MWMKMMRNRVREGVDKYAAESKDKGKKKKSKIKCICHHLLILYFI